MSKTKQNNIEQWKEIVGYEGYYEVSNFGNIRSMDRVIYKKDGTHQVYRSKMVKQWLDSKGRYYMVSLSRDAKKTNKLVHILVAEAFCNKRSDDETLEVNHIDKNTHNNHYKNLEWITHKENLYYSYDTMGPVRNKRKCVLVWPDGKRKEFETISEMKRYRDKYNLPFGKHAVAYYGHSKGFTLLKP